MMDKKDMNLWNLGNEVVRVKKLMEYLDPITLQTGIFKELLELINDMRIIMYSDDAKKSIRYFMTEMTQEEFESFNKEMEEKPYKFNLIKKHAEKT